MIIFLRLCRHFLPAFATFGGAPHQGLLLPACLSRCGRGYWQGMFVRVLPDQAAGRLLDYRVPECFGDAVAVGSRVKVPVRTRMLTATVVEVLDFSGVRGVRDIAELLDEKGLRSTSGNPATCTFIASDSPLRFRDVGRHFVGDLIGRVEYVDVEAWGRIIPPVSPTV